MIFVKVIGASIITITALFSYSNIIKFQKKRIKQMNAFIDLIDYIKNQVECFLLPLDQILRTCDKNLLNNCGFNLKHSNYKNMKELIASANFYCEEEVIELLNQFADTFGKVYLSEQIRSCEYFKNELIKIRNKNQEKDTKNQKIQLAVFLSASFSIIILLI